MESEKILALQNALKNKDTILIEELWNSSKAFIASLAQRLTGKHVLIVTGASQEEMRLFHDFSLFTERTIVDFPSWETIPSENIPPSPDIVGERYQVLKGILSSNEPHIVLTSLQSCLQRLIAPKNFLNMSMTLVKGQAIPFEELLDKLQSSGYRRSPTAADKGEFAVRGGIIDVFPVSSPDPFRLEFWGDELESIRIYDPIGQCSVRQVDSAEIVAALEMEMLPRFEEHASLLDYLGPNTLVILDDLLALEDRYATLISSTEHNPYFSSIEEFLNRLQPLQKILWAHKPIEELGEIKDLEIRDKGFYSQQHVFHKIQFEMFNRQWDVQRWTHPFLSVPDYLFSPEEEVTTDALLPRLASLDPNAHLFLLCSSELEESNLHQRLIGSGISLPSHVHYNIGYLSSGFVVQDVSTIIFPMTELTRRYKIRRQKQRSTYHTSPVETFDLTPGEMVVHINNGIGRYLGLERRSNHMGISSEFFVIEYAEQAKLYVPLNQANLISKYIGAHDTLPRMHTLGSTRWKKMKEQTERAILGYAADLLQIYAKREMHPGFIYPEDSTDLIQFEEEFPFVETEDQLAAISSIKQDMILPQVMDRLICGDVGYGKTEVAMRAAFKAVLDGKKQVAVLVPTTVLAMQHYDSFVERMSNFPIKIEVLSRFRSAKQIKEAIEGLEKGLVDIVVGTHRLISDDVKFKDLGLVIIDEEQRFGVRAKEHLKKIKTGVDCLTLSATPIPRTLYMSLIGARDISVINTPPQDRLPIKTIITEPNDQTIKSALLRELARGGQAFIIHNRVETIFSMASRIKALLPQARVLVAHGQMDAEEIDATFHAFKNGKADILIATTIVENGIDIPNANTILIDRADTFGLATLYQLRGRVGRWNRRAYAYFLVPRLSTLPELTRKRLEILVGTSGYGGGMEVAKRDLELRGAGNILGEEQSGHVASIGFHLYCKLLKRTMDTMQGKIPSVMADTKVDLAVDARITEDYINEVSLRMEIYQRMGEASTWEEVDILWNEILDRYGTPPEPALWLFHLTRVKVFASRNGFILIKYEKNSVQIEKKIGQETITRKIQVTPFKTPQEMEKRLLEEMENTTKLNEKSVESQPVKSKARNYPKTSCLRAPTRK